MNLNQLHQRLLPRAERDPGFREHVMRLSHSGLQILGAVEIAVPLLLLFGRLAVEMRVFDGTRLWEVAALAGVGVLTLALASAPWSRKHARLLAGFSAFLAPTLATWAALLTTAGHAAVDDYVLMGTTLVVLTAVATVPFRPWQAFSLGLGIEGMYILSSWLAWQWEFPVTLPHGDAHYIFLLMLALLATGIATTNFDHRLEEHQAHQEALQAAEALTGAQLRAQLAENAISIGKMAAALTHEINSPLGTLRSSIETLVMLTARQVDAPPEDRARLAETRVDLERAIDESAVRIEDVTRRLRRFVNLAEAELKSADLNDLLSDVALLHDEDLRRSRIRLDLDLEKGLAPLTCRPQLLSSVFSTLLSNAINAVNGDGRIAIETRRHASEVEVTIRDNGRGIPADEAETMFDPSFKVEGGRISSGNWSLFNSRQIVYEHGGEIRVETAEGQGTAVHVMLPLTLAFAMESPVQPAMTGEMESGL